MGRAIPDPRPAGGGLPKGRHGKKPPNPQAAPKSHGRRPSPPPVRKGRGMAASPKQKNPNKGCCPMVAAVRAARRGRFRLAGRYARWSVRLIAGRVLYAQ